MCVHLLEMVVFTTYVFYTSPREKEFLSFLPPSEAFRMLIQVEKACSRNNKNQR